MSIKNTLERAGVLQEEELREFGRWGRGVPEEGESATPFTSHQEACIELERLEQQNQEPRTTDLDAIHRFHTQAQQGNLVVFAEEDGSEDSAMFSVLYLQNPDGTYLIPYKGETLKDLVVNEKSHLVTSEGQKVFFRNAVPLHYGDIQAFLRLTPTT